MSRETSQRESSKQDPAGLVLKEVRHEDASERSALVAFVNAHYPSPLPLSEASVAAGRATFFWVSLKSTGERVGVTGYMVKTPSLVETVKTVVDPQFRGRGMGEALSAAIEAEVKRRGFKKVMSTIYIDNLPMIFIKLKQGYRFEGFHPDHEQPGLHEYSFGKVLT